MNDEIRWIYRFENFSWALKRLDSALEVKELSDLAREGMTRRFRHTFELALKTMMDRMAHEGTQLPSRTPRTVIRIAFQAGLIDDGQTWIDMLDRRNAMSHDYDEQKFLYAEEAIRNRYSLALERFFDSFTNAATNP